MSDHSDGSNPSSAATTTSQSSASTNFIVPGLFPRRSLSLLVSAPRTGALCLLLPQFESYLAERKFLGYELASDQQPEQVGILTARSFDKVFRKIRSLELDQLSYPQNCPIEEWRPLDGVRDIDALHSVIDHLQASARRPIRFLLIEGIQLLMSSGKINELRAVRDFLSQIQSLCVDRDVTILGTVGSMKLKRGESYPLLQHRILGSVQWAANTATLIGLEQMDPHLPIARRSTWREITVMPPCAPPVALYADFDKLSRLVLKEKPVEVAESIANHQLDLLLVSRPDGEQFARRDFLDWGEGLGYSSATVDRWLALKLDVGELEKTGNTRSTIYQKPLKN